MDKTILLVYQWGDDGQVVIGVATDSDAAEKLIVKAANRFDPTELTKVGDNKFRKSSAKDGEDYHYWAEKVKINHLL